MTQAEFEVEARRVLLALGVEANAPVKITHKEDTPYPAGSPWHDGLVNHFYLIFKGEETLIEVVHRIGQTQTAFGFFISDLDVKWTKAWTWRFIDKTDDSGPHIESIKGLGHQTKYDSLGMRALYRLGYDIDPIAEKAGIVVTAHEKLEWDLEKQEGEVA